MDFHDTRIIKSVSTAIILDNGEIREISNNFPSGAAVRVLSGGTWGFVSLDNIEKIDVALVSAKRLADAAGNKSPRKPIKLAPIEKPAF
ncbi:MAG: TldD/PmbA family protein, partial [Candidatus Methanoperedens sp.]|nr:TldD/PmbA family protein [Candidatus Methanoperedens sp.]